jgi:SAM-dependent methyltransferase
VTNDHEHSDPAEFDRFRDSYQDELDRVVAFAGQDADVYMAAKTDALITLARRHLGDPLEIDVLDVGCGIGAAERHLLGHVRSVSGVDISAAMIDRARAAYSEASYLTYDGTRIPHDDETFGLVFASCVVHHVPTTSWGHFVAEMTRVTRRGGVVAIAEHNPWNPLTRAVVNRCAFDHDATLISQRKSRALLRSNGLDDIETRNILFLPWRGRLTDRLENLLRIVPLGAQYVVAGRRA